jgi:catechol 2,3-dioxygenase-like lactoylglutathione lyase family enzyme
MRITLSSVMVDDQEEALKFYTEVLGFTVSKDVKAGEYRWLTVASPEGPEGVELLLEPTAFPPAKVYQAALREAGIPATSFASTNINAEYERLTAQGVVFKAPPKQESWGASTMFDDTCGNWIRLAQVP